MAIPKDFSAPHGIITDGKIGIGTQTPSTSLSIEHSSGAYASATTTTSSGISEWSTYNSDGFGTFMGVYGTGTTPNGPIGAGDSYLYSNANSLVFATDTGVIKFGTGSTLTERVQIGLDGRVGLGTSSPSMLLDVRGNSSSDTGIISKNSGIGRATVKIDAGGTSQSFLQFLQAGAEQWRFSSNGSTSFGLYDVTNSAYRMFVDSTGKIGIGTNAPTAKLEVNGNIKLGTSATINNASGYLLVQATGGELVLSAGSSSPIGFRPGGAATNQAVFDTNGNLIVGSTAQITTEKVRFEKTNDGAVSINARLSNTGTTTGTGESIVFTGFTNNAAYVNHGIIQSYATDTAGNSAMTFHTAASGITAEHARIDSLGNLGIGTTTPVSKLDVSGTVSHNVVAVPALTMDLASGMYFTKTVTAPSTFTITNVPASRYVTWTLKLTNGGSSVITWPVTVKWPSGTAPVLTASGVDIITFFTDDGGVTVHGLLASKDSR